MKIISAIYKIGLIAQVLALVALFFVKTPIMSCPDAKNINPTNNTETYNSNASFLKAAPHGSPDEKYKLASLILFKFRELETTLQNADIQYGNSMIDWLRYLLAAGCFMALSGLIIMVFRKKKLPVKQFHLCSLIPVVVPLTYQSCIQCKALIKHSKKKESLSEDTMIWVVEITVSSAVDRKKTLEAIDKMSLPLIRLENNFIIIGTYKRKSEAVEIIRNLHDVHNVRGWLTPGN